jgi:predicted membrane-bound spermidine synthase
LAGLVYEVTWTRLLTLYLGHTTAAASAVVAAFLGGLAIGAAIGGRFASSWTPRRCLRAYVALEIAWRSVRALPDDSAVLAGAALAYNDVPRSSR